MNSASPIVINQIAQDQPRKANNVGECRAEVEALVAKVERQGFVSRSGGRPRTDNPFPDAVESASDDAGRQIYQILADVWARGWDKADKQLEGGRCQPADE